MNEVVEISDRSSDSPAQREQIKHPVSFLKLRTMKMEVENRQKLLDKSWSDLHEMLSHYHATLVLKHEQYEDNFDDAEKDYIAVLETKLEKKNEETALAERTIAELESKLLAKDSEIVRLRTDDHTLKNEVTMKNSLLQKLQHQMTKEAMDYSTEISSLREAIGLESNIVEHCPPNKRTRTDNPVRLEMPPLKLEPATESCVRKSKRSQSIKSSNHSTSRHHALTQPEESAARLQTFSMATMPHLTLATTSTDAMHLELESSPNDTALNADDGAEADYGQYVLEPEDEKIIVGSLLEQEIDKEQSSLTHQVDFQMPSGCLQSQDVFRRTSETSAILSRHAEVTWTTQQLNVARYTCRHCGKAFGRASNLRQHIKIHENVRAFTCPFCAKSFLHKHHLQRHKWSAAANIICSSNSTDRIHQCSYCNWSFREKHDLVRHERASHLRIRPFVCNVCGKDFARKYHLSRHLFHLHDITDGVNTNSSMVVSSVLHLPQHPD